MFILPQGATPRLGTTWFTRRDGREITIDEPGPVWTLFENSRVLHAPTPGKLKRPTVELDIVPALRTTTVPKYAGINGWYPLFPWT